MMPFYLKLFNLVFNTGIIPETWPVGNLKPKHMKKVVMLTYKLSSYFKSVVLERILCRRLIANAVNIHLIRENQIGFRGNHSTIDSMFVLYSLIKLSLLRKRNFSVPSLIFKLHSTNFGE